LSYICFRLISSALFLVAFELINLGHQSYSIMSPSEEPIQHDWAAQNGHRRTQSDNIPQGENLSIPRELSFGGSLGNGETAAGHESPPGHGLSWEKTRPPRFSRRRLESITTVKEADMETGKGPADGPRMEHIENLLSRKKSPAELERQSTLSTFRSRIGLQAETPIVEGYVD
jgi:hypothetical protein